MKKADSPAVHRELFLAPDSVASLDGGVSFRLHHPVPRERIANLWSAGPGYQNRYFSVFEDGAMRRMTYGQVALRYDDGKPVREPEMIAMAQSRDGLDWEAPVVGRFEHAGSRANPVIWMEGGEERLGIGGFSPFLDKNPDCPPSERYKAIAEAGPHGKAVLGHNGLLALASPDGVQWRMLSSRAVMTGGPGIGGFDSQNLAFWDALRGEYRLYRREVFRESPGAPPFRDILTATSPDFLHWSAPKRLCYQTGGAAPFQLYTNNVMPYFRAPQFFIGLPVRYVQRKWGATIAALPERERREALIRRSGGEPTESDPTGGAGQRVGTALTDVLLMSSRDGTHFHLWPEAFIRPGLRHADQWFYGDNFPAWGLLQTPSSVESAPQELSFYVTEGTRHPDRPASLRRHTLRLDGFTSVEATHAGGRLLTRALKLPAPVLSLNFSTSVAGSLRVAVCDVEGAPLSGFEREACEVIVGDELERRVVWRGAPSLASHVGREVRLEITMSDSNLYSYAFHSLP